MKKLVVIVEIVFLSCSLAIAAPKVVPPLFKENAVLLAPSDLKWEEAGRVGTWMALGEGDPFKGPAHFYLKYDKGFAGGLHYHTHDHGGWVLSGTVIIDINGKETRLPQGSFYYIKAKQAHIAKCDLDSECLMTVDVRGKWDAVSVMSRN